MSPDWFREERRSGPSDEETRQLFLFNLREIARHTDEDRKNIALNAQAISRLEMKIDTVMTHVKRHEEASTELLESFRSARAVRRFFAWFAGGLVGLITVFFQGHELWQHVREIFTTKP
jgi:hypothetical protein